MNEFRIKHGIVIDDTTPINNISNDYTLSGNSDSTLVTESAIVSYVNTIVVDIQDELDLKLDVSAYTPFNSNEYTTTASFNSHTTNTSNPHTVTKTQVGLSAVDNTSDTNKPISTATQTALNLKFDTSGINQYATSANLNSHITNTSNPHSVTKTQVGLSNVDNTSDVDKPISTATQTALNSKFDTSGISNYTTTASFNSHVGSGGSAHAVVTSTVNGFMLSADKVKLDSLGTSNGDESSLNVVGATSGSWVDSGINVNQVGLNAKEIKYIRNGVSSRILLSSEDFDPSLTQAQLSVESADLTSNALTVRPDLTITLKPIQHADGTEINQSATVGQLQTALNSKYDTSGGILNGDLQIGTMSYVAANSPVDIAGNTNSYYQLVIQNKNAGVTASSDIVVNNNISTDSTYYGDFGINSSGFTGAGSFQLPNATYLYGFSGELVLGTRSANGVRFVVNDGATDSARILSTGEWGIGATPTTGAALTLPAGIAAKAPLNIGAFSATKTSPVDGDVWKSAADSLVVRMSTNTRTFGFLEKAQTWTSAQTFSAASNNFSSTTDVTVGTFTTGAHYTAGGASVTKTLQVGGLISQRTQSSATTTGSITWALGSGGGIDLTGALTGDITLAMSAAVAGSISKCTFVQGSTARAITLTHTGVTFNIIGKTETGSGSISIPSTEFAVNNYYALVLHWATATKCFVEIVKLPSNVTVPKLIKNVFVEAPVADDFIPIFRNDTGGTITITDANGFLADTGSVGVRLYTNTTYATAGATALGTATTTLTSTTATDINTATTNTCANGSWVFLKIETASTSKNVAVSFTYTEA